MQWINIKEKCPSDDEAVLVTNIRVKMLPTKAYYDEESKEFLDIESLGLTPLSITHWMPLPDYPKK